ncbi:hypothetical protein NQZ79_g1059 [Umbelopsis isabellina]|nr:hypothetical protein NQZ79_g1059 [Umbelopsis isabellina]
MESFGSNAICPNIWYSRRKCLFLWAVLKKIRRRSENQLDKILIDKVYGVFISVFGAARLALAESRANVSQVLQGIAVCDVFSSLSCKPNHVSDVGGVVKSVECDLLLVKSGIGVVGGERSCASDSGGARIAFSNALYGEAKAGITKRSLVPFSRHP